MPIYRMAGTAGLGWDVRADTEAEALVMAQQVYDVLWDLSTTLPAFGGASSEIVVLPIDGGEGPSIQGVLDDDDGE